MVIQLQRDGNFFLLVFICSVRVILCDSLDGLAPWQPWTRCSVSCGNGEQTRWRECHFPSFPDKGKTQKMHSEDIHGCRDNKSVIIRRPCIMVPCSYLKKEFDPSSLPSYSYSLTDPSKSLLQEPGKDNLAATVDQYGYVAAYDDNSTPEMVDDNGCSELNQSLACSNSTNDRHRLRRAIRLSLGEMIYSNWTPWSTCSCDTETNKRYRFCIVNKRQCLRTKGLFPTVEISPCSCWESTKKRKNKFSKSRKFPSDKYDPYSPWGKWSGCPCEKDAFRSRTRMCRPGHEVACFERKQQTGIGIAQLKKCQPAPGCHGIGPMSNLVAEQKQLLKYQQQPHPVPAKQVPPQPSNTMTMQNNLPKIPSQSVVNYEYPGIEEYSPGMEEEYAEETELSEEEGYTESIATWSAWGEWKTCSESCGTGQTTRWRECLDENEQVTQGCVGGDYSEAQDCNTQSCPVEETVPQMPASSSVAEEAAYGHESSENLGGVCRVFTSDTVRTEPTSREPITAGLLDTRPEYDECPAYYGFVGEL